jgi:uroporphyrinogen-III decarboxylase
LKRRIVTRLKQLAEQPSAPTAIFLQQAAPEEVRAETERILNSGSCDGGRFVLREGNNLAPGTPLSNLEAMYAMARAWAPQA